MSYSQSTATNESKASAVKAALPFVLKGKVTLVVCNDCTVALGVMSDEGASCRRVSIRTVKDVWCTLVDGKLCILGKDREARTPWIDIQETAPAPAPGHIRVGSNIAGRDIHNVYGGDLITGGGSKTTVYGLEALQVGMTKVSLAGVEKDKEDSISSETKGQSLPEPAKADSYSTEWIVQTDSVFEDVQGCSAVVMCGKGVLASDVELTIDSGTLTVDQSFERACPQVTGSGVIDFGGYAVKRLKAENNGTGAIKSFIVVDKASYILTQTGKITGKKIRGSTENRIFVSCKGLLHVETVDVDR
jgi:hypothetical protein